MLSIRFVRKMGKLGGVPQNGQGGDYNTRQLSDKVIAAALQGSSSPSRL